VIVSLPTAKAVVLKVAVPVEARVAVPSVVPPSLKVTVPVGVLVPDVWEIVAVKVTDCPEVAGLGEAVTAVLVTVVPGLLTVSVTVLLLAA
jgi:hypothetical protein